MSDMSKIKTRSSELTDWLIHQALPVWHQGGIRPDTGDCFETISLTDQEGVPGSRRARVPPRQIYSFLEGELLGWTGPAKKAAFDLWAWYRTTYRAKDGTFHSIADMDNAITDDRFDLYNQAFALFAMAHLAAAAPEAAGALEREAEALLERLKDHYEHPDAGFRETNPDTLPLRSNPHMHLFEASLAWEAVSSRSVWSGLADEIANLALTRFIDPVNGGLREFFTSDWAPMPDSSGQVMEPGHQFEWAWLLVRWGVSRSDSDALVAARRLYDIGWTYGIDESRGVAFMALNDDFTVRDPVARLWGQTEWIKAAVALAEISLGPEREAYLADILSATDALTAYFEDVPPGLYKDKWLIDGSFVDEPAPASSLYHIVCAISELNAFAMTL